MTRLEEAAKIIAESYREDCKEYDTTIRGFFKIMGYDTQDLKQEFWYALRHSSFKGEFTDDCEIIEDEGYTVHTFGELSRAVRKYQF